ncbi:hypothetical protein [Methylobacterium bullatum]|uniref:HTH merR-type domain-containing protein n=1 Tax=Methylobacterium bullatum TaxID=570505 RepID=A0AAV4ZE59_9HYPH|nr:hypothetical protein [Methylobacterium bullatum]MBD8902912.1 hypothetical protein [Methylobacterium bullatum]GJD41949.1 hypothetical protein OICFNHDK_4435 [Methylobacterium bullatum]
MTDHESDPRIPVLMTGDEPGPYFTVGEIAKEIEADGVPFSVARSRVVSYANKRLIHVRAPGGSVGKANMFALPDLATAKILSNIQDLGVSDTEVLQHASLQAYAYCGEKQIEAGVGRYYPMSQALREVFKGEHWVLQIEFRRHVETQERFINTAFGNVNFSPIWRRPELRGTTDIVPVGSIQCVVSHALMSLRRHVFPAGN